MNESTESSAEGLLEARHHRISAFRIHPSQLSYIDYGKVVASGGFGQVKKAVYTSRTRNRSSAESPTTPESKTPGITVAVKMLQMHMEVDQERLEKRFMREAYVWSQLKNDHIIDFLGFYFLCSGGKTEALLICPWMEHGESVRYVKQQRLRPVERLHLLLDAAKGLQYLHSRVPPICHGDIKGSNVLIKNDGGAAICDFGLAQVLDEEFERLASQTTQRGTIRWTSPERLEDNRPLAPSSDVWSWAWLIWEFMTEKIPFHFVSHASAVIFHIVTLKFPAYDQEAAISEIPTLSKLMQLCWQKEPGSRLSMEECTERLEHILEGFEPPEVVGKSQNMTFVGTSTLFQPTATPGLPSGSPPPAEFHPSDRTLFDLPTGTSSQPPRGASIPPAYTGPIIPSRSDEPRKDLPPIPGQDGETPILATFDSSHEQRTDLEPSLGVKPWSANVPANPPNAFNFIPSHSQSPRDITVGNYDPSYHVNSDSADLRHQLDYVMENILRTLQRLESSQEQHSLREQDITNYRRQLDEWLSRAPVFESPYLSGRPLPIFIPAGQPPTVVHPPGQVVPFIPMPREPTGITSLTRPISPAGPSYSTTSPSFSPTSPRYSPTSPAGPSDSPIPSTQTGALVQPPLIIQQPAQPTAIQPPTQIVPPVLNHQPTGPSRPLTVLSYYSTPPISPQHPQPPLIIQQPTQPPIVPPVWTPEPTGRPGPPLTVLSYESSPRHLDSPLSSTSSHPRDFAFQISTGFIRNEAGLPAIRQFKHSEIKLEPENEFDGKGEAQMGVLLETGTAIALKPVNFQLESGIIASERALISEFDGWLRLWGSLEHENIAKVLGSAFVNEVPSVITEWCTSGNITQYLEKAPQTDRHSLLRQVAQGLNYLHTASPRMIHSNLKPNNILIDGGRVKLADIGILVFLETQKVGAEMHGRAGDARWTAPEVLEGRARRWRADIYSFGCLALFILRDELPYATLKTDVAVSKAIYRGDLPINREAASALHSTWKLCWAQDPKRRPDMSTILESLESW